MSQVNRLEHLAPYAEMVLNAEKRRQFSFVALQLRASPGLSIAYALAPTTSTPGPSTPTPVDQRQKGVVEATASEDEDTCSGLIFKRKRKVDVAIPVNSASDDRAPSFKEHPPSAFSPRDLVVQEGGGRVPLGTIVGRPLLICLPSSNRPCSLSKIKGGWRAWRRTPCKSTHQSALGTFSLHIASP